MMSVVFSQKMGAQQLVESIGTKQQEQLGQANRATKEAGYYYVELFRGVCLYSLLSTIVNKNKTLASTTKQCLLFHYYITLRLVLSFMRWYYLGQQVHLYWDSMKLCVLETLFLSVVRIAPLLHC